MEPRSIEAEFSGYELACEVVRRLDDKKALRLVAFDLRGQGAYTDFVVVASGTSDRQVRTLADHLAADLKQHGVYAHSLEGMTSAHWVLVDFIDVVAHIFYDPVRGYFDLEGLWPQAPRLDVDAIVGHAREAATEAPEAAPLRQTAVPEVAAPAPPPRRRPPLGAVSSDDPDEKPAHTPAAVHPLVRRRKQAAGRPTADEETEDTP